MFGYVKNDILCMNFIFFYGIQPNNSMTNIYSEQQAMSQDNKDNYIIKAAYHVFKDVFSSHF